jgi:hypothetical protein
MVNEAVVINSIIINLGILIRRIVKTAIYVIYIMIFHGSLTTETTFETFEAMCFMWIQ